MVQQIRSLIVQPAVDASKYTAGAGEKVAADKAMAASSREAGAAVTDTSAKISASGDVLARLSRQFVDGYAAEQRFNQGLNQLNRGLESGKITMEGAERILIGMNQRLGLTADVAQIAAKGQNELAAAVLRANVQIERQATELAEAAVASQRLQAANSNVISHGARQAAGFNAGQQLQDIAMMSILGQAPGTLALQQGPALASAIQQGGGLAALGAGLGSLLSVTTLLTVGFTAATAATIQWFMKGREGAKDLDEVLKSHSATLSRLKQQYGELGDASKNIGGPVGGSAYTEAQARSEVDTIRAAIRSQSGDLSKTFIGGSFLRGGMFGSNTGGLDDLLASRNSPFQQAVDDLLSSIRSGKGGLEKFDANLNKIFDDLRGKSSEPAKLAEEMQRLSDAAIDAFSVTGKMSPFQSEIDRLLLGLKEGNSDLSSFATNVRRIGELNGIGKQADDAILAAKEVVNLAEKLKEVEQVLRRIDQENTRPGLRDQRELRRYVAGRDADVAILDQQFAADQQLARARSNSERLAAIEAQVRSRAKEDGDSGGGLQARVDRALAEERTRQEVEARDAAILRSQSIERSIQQHRLQLDLIGKTGAEQAKLTYEFERMQELREQAARTGEPIDQKEVANIKAAAEAMGKYADALARAKMGDELSFERSQFFRSPLEQQIASRQRSSGLPIDMNSPEALQMRQLDRMERIYERGMSFWDDFENGIKNGDDFGEALGDAIRNAVISELTDVAKTAFSNFLKEGIRVFMGGGSGAGASAGAGAFGTATGFAEMLFGSGKGAANDNFSAPRSLSGIGSPVAGMEVFRNAIASIESVGSGGYSALGPIHKTMGQALGRYQIMEANLPAWSKAALGHSVSRSQFMGSPALQDAIFDHRFGGYVDKYGASGAASMWFTGRPNAPSATDVLGTTGSAYVEKFNAAVSKAGKSLDTFGGGLGKLGHALNQFPAAPSGGAGGILGSLFGGLNSAFSGSKAFNFLSANPGSYIGLYHTGGIAGSPSQMRYVDHGVFLNAPRYHSGGIAGDEVPAILKRGEPVFRSMEHARQVVGGNNAPSGVADVRVYVDQDGNWQAKVEKISEGPARQESNRAVGNYAYRQSNGGAKADDHRYQRLKRRA